jgi:hypothetical protein
MIISDLTYLETATDANSLEGGILTYDMGSVFVQRIQGIQSGVASGPMGTAVGTQIVDVKTLTFGGVKVWF